MRPLILLVALLAAGASDLRAQVIFGGGRFDFDTLSVPRIVEEWQVAHGGQVTMLRHILESILWRIQDPPDLRADELFEALIPIMGGELMVSTRTAGILGRAEAEVGGRWTGLLLDLPRQLLDEGRYSAVSSLLRGASPALKAAALAPLEQELRALPPHQPFAARILVGAILGVPGGRESLQGMVDRRELRGDVGWVASFHLKEGG